MAINNVIYDMRMAVNVVIHDMCLIHSHSILTGHRSLRVSQINLSNEMAQERYSPTFDLELLPLDLSPLPESCFKTDTVTEAELIEAFSLPPPVTVSWPSLLKSDVSDAYLRELRELDEQLLCDEAFDDNWESVFSTPPPTLSKARKRKKPEVPGRPLRAKKKKVQFSNPKSRKKLVF